MSASANADAATIAVVRTSFMAPPETLLAFQGKRITYEAGIANSPDCENFARLPA
jgi:hypothetical protein